MSFAARATRMPEGDAFISMPTIAMLISPLYARL